MPVWHSLLTDDMECEAKKTKEKKRTDHNIMHWIQIMCLLNKKLFFSISFWYYYSIMI